MDCPAKTIRPCPPFFLFASLSPTPIYAKGLVCNAIPNDGPEDFFPLLFVSLMATFLSRFFSETSTPWLFSLACMTGPASRFKLFFLFFFCPIWSTPKLKALLLLFQPSDPATLNGIFVFLFSSSLFLNCWTWCDFHPFPFKGVLFFPFLLFIGTCSYSFKGRPDGDFRPSADQPTLLVPLPRFATAHGFFPGKAFFFFSLTPVGWRFLDQTIVVVRNVAILPL